ncbi:MAG: hypothetical protein F4039_07060 [Gammaproteobacteria bacterium]|nr:hypothetical protein [Gammaproteobacteria bacterium]MYK43828.1 hypothetical protein [Gammaproteobacteria bacterium]
MTNQLFLTKKVYDAFNETINNGRKSVLPGDIVQNFREKNEPVGIWLVMRELTRLEELDLVQFDQETATWTLGQEKDFFEVIRNLK